MHVVLREGGGEGGRRRRRRREMRHSPLALGIMEGQ
jgi:hypothetical protein